MKTIIRKILKEETTKYDGLCSIMTVDTYEDGIELLIKYLGTPNENPKEWEKIKKPLSMWKDVTIEIRNEIRDSKMSGDSEVDESDTWWSAIQSTFCR